MFCTFICMLHSEIIDRWPSLTDFASDLSVEYGTAKAMRRRGSIPPDYWPTVVQSASRRGINGVSLELLVQARSRFGAAPARKENAQ